MSERSERMSTVPFSPRSGERLTGAPSSLLAGMSDLTEEGHQ
jgi:hypothetical protein